MLRFEIELMRLDQMENLGLYVIADGMGGHVNGDRASATAVAAFSLFFFERIMPLFLNKESDLSILPDLLEEGVMQANQTILDDLPGSGTTFTAALVWEDKLFVVHIGDSRLFIVNKEFELEKITRDHSLVQMMVDLGEITEEEALTHPRRSVLLKSLGFEKEVEFDFYENRLETGEMLLLCCDGLWSVLEQQKISKILRENPFLKEATAELVAAANKAGGPDNISCILVKRN